jgi:glycosyltransferase involved in cell wall biosynthesis
MKKVSVIVACRNEEGFLHKCLLSLLDQDYPADFIEIIVVDGMSTDKTWGVANSFKEQYPNLRLQLNQKTFKYPGLNQAIKECSGDYVAIADAHSEYPRNYLSEIMAWLDHGYGANVGGGRVFFSRSTGWLSRAINLVQTLGFWPSHG